MKQVKTPNLFTKLSCDPLSGNQTSLFSSSKTIKTLQLGVANGLKPCLRGRHNSSVVLFPSKIEGVVKVGDGHLHIQNL